MRNRRKVFFADQETSFDNSLGFERHTRIFVPTPKVIDDSSQSELMIVNGSIEQDAPLLNVIYKKNRLQWHKI
jgi:hypothetical protein